MENMPQQSRASEVAITAAELTLEAIPFVGNVLATVFNKAANAEFEQRKAQWLVSLGETLSRMETKIANLGDDPEFVETVIAAATAASKTLHKEKLDALRNAVINATDESKRPDEDLRLRFITYIDQMVPDHLRILEYFESPQQWFEERRHLSVPSMMTSDHDLALIGLEWDRSEMPRLERLASDLTTWRLLGLLSGAMKSSTGALQNRYVTADGYSFLAYIRNN